MRYIFRARGHKNILANHRSTLEFTKDKVMSLDGDCIVGIGADFSLQQLQRLVRSHKHLRMRIKAGDCVDEIDFTANKNFSSEKELVLRFSEFSSDRTFGFRATKSAKQLDRQLVEMLRDPDQDIIVEIEPLMKVIIFDFDNTIEDFKVAKDYTHSKLAKRFLQEYNIYVPTALKLLYDVDKHFSIKGIGSKPVFFDRHLWIEEVFKRAGVDATKKEIDDFVTLYWRFAIEAAKPMPHAESVLRELKKSYKIAVISDSDGTKNLKIERAKTVGLLRFVDFFMTSDDTGVNKPDKSFYSGVFKRFGVKAEECVMVGDKPQVDLVLAKELGMKTVWVKHGDWAKRLARTSFDYVDYEINDLKQLLKIMREL